MALISAGILTQEADPIRKMIVDTYNGFNELSCLSMLWYVWYPWLTGARSLINWYMHWAQLLLRQPGEPPVTILNWEGVTQGYPLAMVLYGITLIPLVEEIRVADQGLLYRFCADDVALDGMAKISMQLLKLLI